MSRLKWVVSSEDHRVPTQLPDRVPVKPEPDHVAAWIAGVLAMLVLVGLTMHAPAPCETGPDGGCIDADTPQHFVRIVMARAAPITFPAR